MPLADGAPVPLRDRALRRLLEGRGVRLRPPVPLGVEAHRPDLHRVGGKYPDSWHYLHMKDPRSTSPNSIMPAYAWLYDQKLDLSHTEGKIITLRRLGVPYPEGYEAQAVADAQAQAAQIAANLKREGVNVAADAEIIALIAYLQRLGTDIKVQKPVPPLAARQAGPQETARK